MRAGKFLCAVLCALGATALVPGVALAVPVNNTPPQVLDSNSDPATAATVGQTLTCSPGDWTSANDFAYEFKRDGTPIGGFGANDTYQVASADIGHALSCTVRATDTGDSMTADQDSSNSVDAFPAPTLNITRFSPAVSGNIGEHVQGVIVTVSLQRPDSASNSYDVAAVTVPTDANGHWQGTLANVNPVGGAARVPWTDGDLISVKYAQGTAPGGTTLPADGNYTLFFGDLNAARISPDGTTGAYTPEGSCATGQFIVNGGAPVTETGSGSCTAPLGTPVTDEDTVLLRENRVKGDGSTLTLTSPVGLVGIGFSPNLSSGIPVCTGDLVSGEVSCEQLKAGSFTLTRARGGQSVNFTLVAGNFGFSNTTIPGGLEAGDVVTLKKQGGTRALTTLHLSPALRFDEVNGDISGGTCSASQWIGSASSLELTCPQDGAVPSGVGIPGQPDELSAGGTQVSVPQFDNVIPADDDSVQPSFQAYVDSDGPPPTTITLTLFHRNSDGSNGAQAAGPVTIDPANGGAVSGLATGRYNAVWRMTDTQGDGTTHDTNTVTTQLTVQPGSQGPQGSAGTPGTNGSNGSTGSNGAQGPAGSQGPAGPVGPRGPAGRDAKVTCVVKPAKGKKKPKITCTVKFAKSAGRVRARLMRGNRVYASGTSVGGVLRLNPRRALPRGTYKLVLIDRHGVRTVGARVVIR